MEERSFYHSNNNGSSIYVLHVQTYRVKENKLPFGNVKFNSIRYLPTQKSHSLYNIY